MFCRKPTRHNSYKCTEDNAKSIWTQRSPQLQIVLLCKKSNQSFKLVVQVLNCCRMPWQGQTDNLIDRFDVRAHLDYIPPVKKDEEPAGQTLEDRQLNYERYRIIAQNSFLAISEEKFLKQLHLEEQFGYTEKPPKKDRTGGAAIGFNYEDGTGIQATLHIFLGQL